MRKAWDAIIIGGGAAGLFCAGVAGQLGKKVLVLDHASTLGEKIRISGGGRCNFTNLHSGPANFLSLNPHFVKSALAKYPATEFIKLVHSYQIAYHEKHQGQLFCDDSAMQIVEMLMAECARGNVTIRHPVTVKSIVQEANGWVSSNQCWYGASSIVSDGNRWIACACYWSKCLFIRYCKTI